jgi:hypothetical protein
MKTKAEMVGFGLGWADARRYAAGTRADRRAIRRRLAKAAGSGHEFWNEYADMFARAADDLAAAILDGRLPRSCPPYKEQRVAGRMAG